MTADLTAAIAPFKTCFTEAAVSDNGLTSAEWTPHRLFLPIVMIDHEHEASYAVAKDSADNQPQRKQKHY